MRKGFVADVGEDFGRGFVVDWFCRAGWAVDSWKFPGIRSELRRWERTSRSLLRGITSDLCRRAGRGAESWRTPGSGSDRCRSDRGVRCNSEAVAPERVGVAVVAGVPRWNAREVINKGDTMPCAPLAEPRVASSCNMFSTFQTNHTAAPTMLSMTATSSSHTGAVIAVVVTNCKLESSSSRDVSIVAWF